MLQGSGQPYHHTTLCDKAESVNSACSTSDTRTHFLWPPATHYYTAALATLVAHSSTSSSTHSTITSRADAEPFSSTDRDVICM